MEQLARFCNVVADKFVLHTISATVDSMGTNGQGECGDRFGYGSNAAAAAGSGATQLRFTVRGTRCAHRLQATVDRTKFWGVEGAGWCPERGHWRLIGNGRVVDCGECCILNTVRVLVHLAGRRYLQHAVAATFCALLFLFAVGTKLAAYHPHEAAAKPIASAKVWQATKSVPSSVEQVRIPSYPVALIALLFGIFAMEGAILVPVREVRAPGSPISFSPLAIRPPPAC